MFFEVEKCPSKHHDLPRNHHDFTIKKPRSTPAFSQNPLQKHTIASQKIILTIKKQRPDP